MMALKTEHGTTRGYWQHKHRGEKACRICLDAVNAYTRDHRARTQWRMRPVPTHIEGLVKFNDVHVGDRVALGFTPYPDCPVRPREEGIVVRKGSSSAGRFVDVRWDRVGCFALWPDMGDLMARVNEEAA